MAAAAWSKRLLALGAFFLAAALLGAAQAKLEPLPGGASLVGKLLIASPDLGDPPFRRTVILVVRHSKEGALGIALNRPMGRFALARLLESLGEKDNAAQGDAEVIAGGPVEPEAAFVIHTADYNRSGTIPINGLVAVTSGKEIVRDIGQNAGPSKFLIAFGYAGWEPNQLESEMAHGVWLTAMADRALIFDEKRERLWEAALERRLRDL